MRRALFINKQRRIELQTSELFPKIHRQATPGDLASYKEEVGYVMDQYANLCGTQVADYLEDKAILEVGCGGRASGILALIGYRPRSITAIDLSPENVRLTREASSMLDHPRISVMVGNALNLEFEDNQFDFVFSDGVIHHTVNMRKCFSELRRVLKSAGCLLLGVYGYGGVFGHVIHPAGMLAGKVIPLKWMEALVNTTGIGRSQDYSLLDWLYTPVQEKHSAKELRGWFAEEGFEDVAILRSPKWPFQLGVLSNTLFGDGYIYAMAKKR
ncbi:MAG: class I SAM-dependent methyltransferase [bacterium]